MKKLKNLIRRLRLSYYTYMYYCYYDSWEIARCEYDESRDECTRLVKLVDKYAAKIDKVK